MGHICVWSLPGMAGLEEGGGREGGRPIASFLPSLGSALRYLSVSSIPLPPSLCSFSLFFSFLLPLSPVSPLFTVSVSRSLGLTLPPP